MLTEWHQRFQGSLVEVAEVQSGKKTESEGKVGVGGGGEVFSKVVEGWR